MFSELFFAKVKMRLWNGSVNCMTNPRNTTTINAPPNKRPAPPKTAPVQPASERRKQTEPSKPKKPKRLRGYPLKSRHIDTCRFFKAAGSSKNGVHEVERVERKGVISYFKANQPGSPMSEIEACNWAFYHFLVPNCVPGRANAHYDDKGIFHGVSLQELPGFVSAMEDPLTPEDLHDENIVIGNAKASPPAGFLLKMIVIATISVKMASVLISIIRISR